MARCIAPAWAHCYEESYEELRSHWMGRQEHAVSRSHEELLEAARGDEELLESDEELLESYIYVCMYVCIYMYVYVDLYI